MGSVPISTPEPRREVHIRRVLFPLASALIALVAAIAAVYFLTRSDDPSYVVAGDVEDFAAEEPVYFEDEGFFLVKLDSGEFLALYEKDSHLGCAIEWRPDFEFQDRMGWFRNPCHGETYDMAGTIVFGPQPRGMDRFPVEVVGGEVRVDTTELICGPGAAPGMVCRP